MGETTKIVITTVISAAVLIGVGFWILGGVTLLEAAAAVALSLLVALTVGRLRESDPRLPADDEGQRHSRGRGGSGLM